MLNNNGFDLWADDYDKSVGLSDEEGCEIYGQDFSERMIELAQEKMPTAKLYSEMLLLRPVKSWKRAWFRRVKNGMTRRSILCMKN